MVEERFDILSRAHPEVKRWREWLRKASVRRKSEWVLLEGPHLIEMALAAGWQVRSVWVSDVGRHAALLAEVSAKGGTVVRVAPGVLAAVSATVTPQGVVAEVQRPRQGGVPWGEVDVVLADGVQDPGNVGALIRVAAAAGVKAVWLIPGCAEGWSPKVLRAAQGAHARVALFEGEVPREVWQPYAAAGRLLVASSEGETVWRLDLKGPLAWVFGNEGAGVGREWRQRASAVVALPMEGIESVNVAAAAAALLFEAVRQRWMKNKRV
ncbi:MAG: RNA methyltransferase [Hydrogenophilus sp.]|nr:RNA methyltransferase [Hydrogenophilus sp.]